MYMYVYVHCIHVLEWNGICLDLLGVGTGQDA